jgi:hypothetical protein
MSKMHFPSEIYVALTDEHGDGTETLRVAFTAEDHDSDLVAVYELRETVERRFVRTVEQRRDEGGAA